MKGFAPTHVPVLRVLGEVWGPDRFIVIGAAAVGYHIGMTWRGTLDLDLSVAAGIDRYEADLKDLGWRQDEKAPQRWYSREGLIVDVVPAEPSSISAGSVVWPDGSTMNLLGFRLAFADAIPVEIVPAATVRVASLRSIVVLKISAYLDKPWERETDLADIAHILQAFVGPDTDEPVLPALRCGGRCRFRGSHPHVGVRSSNRVARRGGSRHLLLGSLRSRPLPAGNHARWPLPSRRLAGPRRDG